MNHWEEQAAEFSHAIGDGVNERAADILAEFALAAPASMVRRYCGLLVEASDACTDEEIRAHFLSTLELVRQRASMTRSSLVLLAPNALDLPPATRAGAAVSRAACSKSAITSSSTNSLGRRGSLGDRRWGSGT